MTVWCLEHSDWVCDDCGCAECEADSCGYACTRAVCEWCPAPVSGPAVVHVTPGDEVIAHEKTEDCPCRPTAKPVTRDDGSVGWLYVHHSLDGREATE